jgi:hypothetical protein
MNKTDKNIKLVRKKGKKGTEIKPGALSWARPKRPLQRSKATRRKRPVPQRPEYENVSSTPTYLVLQVHRLDHRRWIHNIGTGLRLTALPF